jgi:hypothetical protein
VITCRDCAAPIQFLPHPKTGKATPYDDPLPPPPNHYMSRAHIAATRKNGAKPGHTKTAASDAFTESAKMLKEMGFKNAESLLSDIPEAAPEDMVLAALTKMGEE